MTTPFRKSRRELLISTSTFCQDLTCTSSIAALERSIDLGPLNESSYVDLGMILLSYRRYAAAFGVAQTAAKVLPTSYKVHSLKSMTEIRVQYYTDAVKS